MRQVEMEKYPKSPPKAILNNILREIKVKEHQFASRSWQLLVELLAQWMLRNADLTKASMCCRPFQGLDLKQHKELYEHIDSLDLFRHYYVAAKHQPWDYLGDLYSELEIPAKYSGGIVLTPKGLVDMMVKMTYGDIETKHEAQTVCHLSANDYKMRYLLHHNAPAFHVRPTKFPMSTQLDPCVGTGRFLLEASIMFPKAHLVLMGIDVNISMYRACIVNMVHMSNHCFSIICANTLRLDPDRTGPSSKMWDLGNRWSPADITEFYWKPKPEVPFLQRFINDKSE